ncbi:MULTISPECIES: sodium ion-translocating decarboxylase subunit beta [unclassified Imperialibacter]|uniref:sodium ion-translocating decarboxylase subunit beta n=1 Tax=unclassified Imperialibacter TaxID=2629706 RepID=UPI0012551A07|nr:MULTISPECIES: sodium ion-translocating decarboxylase subunit beta [unclassified Imperialibacter]CAD5271407.1 Oxaloacetate decarboxylase beta chain 2 [Imperialibacter sp. 89]CAD5298801.1 Oxaloacetate decarboxylase beta chain 2 [Imperialibacter sp. 75]VVT35056.1 Oxaloacetate decarboxylase beta chain 2 [Imperialibacter sp. EC-SDR9]
MELLEKVYRMTALGDLFAHPSYILMILIGFGLLYLGIAKKYEPLLLVPIAFGVLLANFPGGGMGVEKIPEGLTLPQIAEQFGIMNFVYYALIKTGFLPPIIFMGVGALTDFGPMLRNLRLAFFGAAAQIGIFCVLMAAVAMGFTLKEAAALGIIGGADGPTAIYTTIKLAPHLLGPIAIAAYSYMALVPVIIPFVVRFSMTKKELLINMKEQDKLFPSTKPIKNLQALKIMFPIALGSIVAILVPSSVPLVGFLMFGNLVKEIGVATGRLYQATSETILNSATVFLGLSVGATMTTKAFLNTQTLMIVVGGFIAFAISILGGIMAVKVYNLFAKKKINPLIGATGLSAVPMAARVANEIAIKHDPSNHLLQYAMASNISGVIGSAVAAGVLISFLG